MEWMFGQTKKKRGSLYNYSWKEVLLSKKSFQAKFEQPVIVLCTTYQQWDYNRAGSKNYFVVCDSKLVLIVATNKARIC